MMNRCSTESKKEIKINWVVKTIALEQLQDQRDRLTQEVMIFYGHKPDIPTSDYLLLYI
jgi:hypothetical protein